MRELFGLPVGALTMAEAVAEADHAIRERRALLIGVVNAAKIVNMRRDAELDRAVRSADLILADGMSVVWAARLLRRRLPERVAGIDLMFGMLERGSRRGWRVYLLGATEEVSRAVSQRIRSRYPGVVIAGRRNGYFETAARARVAEDIAAARPDILLVAMTSPCKERFLGDFAERMNVAVCHGVGGAFDVLAGKVRRAPQRWRRWGLEWLFRLLQEPRRLWRRYLVTHARFAGLVLKALWEPPQRSCNLSLCGRAGRRPRASDPAA